MAVEPSLASVSFPLVAIELPIGEFVAEIHKYMDARAKRKEIPKQAMIEDLRAAKAIVMHLTDRYIQSMMDFSNDETVSDPAKLEAAINEARQYLMQRKVLPHLMTLTGEIKGQVNSFPSTLRWLDAVWMSLEAFQASLGAYTITAVDVERFKLTVDEAAKLLKLLKADDPSKMKASAQFKDTTLERYEKSNIRPPDEVYACIGRAIGELKGA